MSSSLLHKLVVGLGSLCDGGPKASRPWQLGSPDRKGVEQPHKGLGRLVAEREAIYRNLNGTGVLGGLEVTGIESEGSAQRECRGSGRVGGVAVCVVDQSSDSGREVVQRARSQVPIIQLPGLIIRKVRADGWKEHPTIFAERRR